MFDESVINPAWFSSRKPYKHKASYDLHYIKICRKIFHLLSLQSLKYGAPLNMDHCRDLAYILTSYFEDQVNQIGFWDAVVKQHEQIYGQRVPFFTKAQLLDWDDCKDIHPADIHYLIFVFTIWVQRIGELRVFPAESFFTELREQVFDCLDEIEEVVLTDFYKEYLVKDPTYVDVKRIMTWFAYDGYLFGHEFRRVWENTKASLKKQMPDGVTQALFNTHLFSELEKTMYTRNSCLSGLFPVDVMADSLRTDTAMTAQIKNVKHLITGVFEFFDTDQHNCLFRHTLTREVFPISKKVLPNMEAGLGIKKTWIADLYRWQDSHIILGICGHEPDEDIVFWHNKQYEYEYKKHNALFSNAVKEYLKKDADEAHQFFKSNPIRFKDFVQLKQGLTAFYEWQFSQDVAAGLANPDTDKPNPFRADHLVHVKDIAIFISDDEALGMIGNYQDHFGRLTALETIYQLCADEWFKSLAFPARIHIDLWKLRSAPTEASSEWTILQDRDFEALTRIYKPSEFSPLLEPQIMLSGKTFKNMFQAH